MGVNALKIIFLTADIDYALKSGGMKAAERSALAQRFGVSEEVIMRYESAQWSSSKQLRQATMEGMARWERSGSVGSDSERDKYFDEILSRLRGEAPEIDREYDEAVAALRAALDASAPKK
jgi:hypothetical protein